MNNDFWFTRDAICHSWKLLANSLTRDPKIVIHGNSCIILYWFRYWSGTSLPPHLLFLREESGASSLSRVEWVAGAGGSPYMHRSVITQQMSNIDANAGIIITIMPYIISYHISYHIIAPTLAPNPTHPCCMPPIYRKPSPKRGKSALKTTLINIYIKSINIVKTPGEINTNWTGCMWYHRPRTCN